MLKLQVLDGDGQWGTLNAIAIGAGAPEVLARATAELTKMQAAWSANYDRFRGSEVVFRIEREN